MQLLHHNATPAAREFARAYVWLLWLGSLLLLPLSSIGRLPFVSHMAVGPFAKLPVALQEVLLSPNVLVGIQLAAIGCVIATLVKPAKIAFPIMACGLITLIQCQLRGFGHVNHAEIVLLLSIYALTYFEFVEMMASSRIGADGLSRGLEIEKSDQELTPGAPLIVIAFLLCMSYSLTGVCRLGDGGFSVFTSGSLTAWQQVATLTPRYFDLHWGEQLMQNAWFAFAFEAGYPLITVVEILAPLCLVSVWFRRVFFATMIPFHILTVLLMGILFWENLALYVVLLNISRWLPVSNESSSSILRAFTSSRAAASA